MRAVNAKISNGQSLALSEAAIHERVGRIVYRLRGWTDLRDVQPRRSRRASSYFSCVLQPNRICTCADVFAPLIASHWAPKISIFVELASV